MPLMKPLSFKA